MSVESFREFSMRHENKPEELSVTLDLRAMEARLRQITPGQERAFAAGYGLPVYPDPTRAEFFALLAHVRALRAALRPFITGTSWETMDRAAAVLAQATDEEGK